MLKKIYLVITLLMVLLVQTLSAQDAKPRYKSEKLMREAKKQYDGLRYVSAIEILLFEIKQVPDDKVAIEMLANSYRNIKDYDNAVKWYGELTKSGNVKPEWALNYAEVLSNKEQYESSEMWYNKYLQLTSGKDSLARSFSKLTSQINTFNKDRNNWKIDYLNINTGNAEYSPMFYKQGIIFASNRHLQGPVKGVFEWDQTPFSDLYYVPSARIEGIKIDSVMDVIRKEIKALGKTLYKENDDDTRPTANDSKILGVYNLKLLRDTLGDYLSAKVKAELLPGKINSKYHEGSATLLPDGSIMFTRNNYYDGKYRESTDGVNKLKIYTAQQPDFTDIKPFPYNSDQYSIGHPAVNSAGTILIFVSDMPGGHGGTDLWYCTRATANDAWGKPINMGSKINTEGNEMFPTLHNDTVLFFSSTGHAGLGGLDIFHVGLNGTEALYTPVNLGAPFNSSVDDFGIIMNDDEKTGYFSSNRKGSDDIYRFHFDAFKIKLRGKVVDAESGRLLDNSTVSIKPEGASLLTTDNMGNFERPLAKEMVYTLQANKNGYVTSQIGKISTDNIHSDTTLTITFRLTKIEDQPKPVIVAAVKPDNCDALLAQVRVRKIYYDLDKSFIRADAIPELTDLVKVLQAHPELSVIVASHTDTRASGPYNEALSHRRSSSANAWLLQHGIVAGRIKIEYFGKTRLTNNCGDGVPCPESEQQLNRRTEFTLVKDGMELQNQSCDWLRANIDHDVPYVAAVVPKELAVKEEVAAPREKSVNLAPISAYCDQLKEQVAVRKIYYDLDKSFIREDAKPEIDKVLAVMQKYPSFTVVINSYCDTRANGDYNDELSKARAMAARKYLADHGIDINRMRIEYYGKKRLVNDCGDGVPCPETEQQLNRRTEFVLLKNGYELSKMECNELQKILK